MPTTASAAAVVEDDVCEEIVLPIVGNLHRLYTADVILKIL